MSNAPMDAPIRRRESARKKWLLAFAAALAAGLAVTPVPAQERSAPAPVYNQDSPAAIPGQYIAVFQPAAHNASAAAQERVKAFGGRVMHVYSSALVGFSVELPREESRAKEALEVLRSQPGLRFIEADQKGTYNTIQPPTPPGAPPTGIDRIDRRLLPMNGTYTYSETGATVHAYVIDSGIRITHGEFGGRATDNFSVAAPDFSDCFNHGTHVAGTIGGTTFGVAKEVALHNVRVGSAGGCVPTTSNVTAGVDWVTANRILPAVANVSIGVPPSPTLDMSIDNSIAAGVTYAVAAGNDFGANACNRSPARVANAITVGATDDADTRADFSNTGTCVDLFAPGVNILSASNAGDAASFPNTGTSMSAPHVAGVAARWLSTHPAATPAQVWAAILNAANTAATPGWGGVVDAGIGSPNVLLHYGSLNDGFTDGDPHIRTVDGVQYDFQSAGEFVLLRDGNGTEIQTRQAAVSTQSPVPNPHTDLSTCTSVNSAVAARVGGRRVTYQPGPKGMELRIDGVLTGVPLQGITIAPGARVAAAAAGQGIDIDFPDGTSMTATSHFWGAPHNRWYLFVSTFSTRASEGVMGEIAPASWLPALPGGVSLGAKPVTVDQRFDQLYGKFADAWRVDKASLFDYAPGESTLTFTDKNWPPKSGKCEIEGAPLAKPMDREQAVQFCRGIRGKQRNAICVHDVAVTGEPGFAEAYGISQWIEAYSTSTTVSAAVDRRIEGSPTVVTASVARRAQASKGTPAGIVEFLIDGEKRGTAKLDERGQARLFLDGLSPGKHRLLARFSPDSSGSKFLPSSSPETIHVTGKE